MDHSRSQRAGTRWWPAAVAVVAVFSGAARGAPVGGGTFAAEGPAKFAVKKSGMAPVAFAGNLRLRFEGDSPDTTGTGALDCYDAEGKDLLASVDFDWGTGRKASFALDLDDGDFAAFLADRIADASGGDVDVTVSAIRAKGALSKDGSAVKVSVSAAGTASLNGGPPLKVKGKIRAR